MDPTAETSSSGSPHGRARDGWPAVSGPGAPFVPDLTQIPREQWRAALREAVPEARRRAAGLAPTVADVGAALVIAAELDLDDGDAASAAYARQVADPPGLPVPVAPGGRSADRQVSFRLTAASYAELAQAARLVDTSPSALARIFAVRGAKAMLREETG